MLSTFLTQKYRASHTTALPSGYGQRSRWRQRLVSRHFLDNLVLVDGLDLSSFPCVVALQISPFYLHCLSIISGIGFFSPSSSALSSVCSLGRPW